MKHNLLLSILLALTPLLSIGQPNSWMAQLSDTMDGKKMLIQQFRDDYVAVYDEVAGVGIFSILDVSVFSTGALVSSGATTYQLPAGNHVEDFCVRNGVIFFCGNTYTNYMYGYLDLSSGSFNFSFYLLPSGEHGTLGSLNVYESSDGKIHLTATSKTSTSEQQHIIHVVDAIGGLGNRAIYPLPIGEIADDIAETGTHLVIAGRNPAKSTLTFRTMNKSFLPTSILEVSELTIDYQPQFPIKATGYDNNHIALAFNKKNSSIGETYICLIGIDSSGIFSSSVSLLSTTIGSPAIVTNIDYLSASHQVAIFCKSPSNALGTVCLLSPQLESASLWKILYDEDYALSMTAFDGDAVAVTGRHHLSMQRTNWWTYVPTTCMHIAMYDLNGSNKPLTQTINPVPMVVNSSAKYSTLFSQGWFGIINECKIY